MTDQTPTPSHGAPSEDAPSEHELMTAGARSNAARKKRFEENVILLRGLAHALDQMLREVEVSDLQPWIGEANRRLEETHALQRLTLQHVEENLGVDD